MWADQSSLSILITNFMLLYRNIKFCDCTDSLKFSVMDKLSERSCYTSHWSPPPFLKCLHWQCLQVSTDTSSYPEIFLQQRLLLPDKRSHTHHRRHRCLWCELHHARPLYMDVLSSTWPALWCFERLLLLKHLRKIGIHMWPLKIPRNVYTTIKQYIKKMLSTEIVFVKLKIEL